MGQGAPNGYGSSTTAEEILGNTKLDGKVVIVTGSNTGIGKETARVLVKGGAHVIIAARDTKKSLGAKDQILLEFPKAKIDLIDLDLGDSKSIDNFVDQFAKLNVNLNILINNAGVMAVPERRTTKDGYEYQNGINHLGHFRLTLKLLPFLIRAEGQKRVVCLSSSGHSFSNGIDFDNYHFENEGSYGPWVSYGNSKLSNILFAKELNARLQKDFGSDKFICMALHPGGIQTELTRDMPSWQMTAFQLVGGSLFLKSIPQGAATTLYGALSKEVKGGEYLYDCNIQTPSATALNLKQLIDLWAFSEKTTGVTYKDALESVKKE
jgi:NAD(P)-dependent dehydrogenase (short-subunit alcohol dehydrogenase family)